MGLEISSFGLVLLLLTGNVEALDKDSEVEERLEPCGSVLDDLEEIEEVGEEGKAATVEVVDSFASLVGDDEEVVFLPKKGICVSDVVVGAVAVVVVVVEGGTTATGRATGLGW